MTHLIFQLGTFLHDPVNRYEALPKDVARLLAREVNYKNRFVLEDMQREVVGWAIQEIDDFLLPARTTTYRAQVGVQTTLANDPLVNFEGYTQEVQTAEQSLSGRAPLTDERMMPKAEFVTDGRANARGIPVLYSAEEVEGAVLEARSPVGAAVSIISLQNRVDLKLADMRVPDTLLPWDKSDNAFNPRLKDEIAIMFSKRVVGDSARYDYLLTQIFSEYIKANGYEGIIYTSSQGDGDNYAFFDKQGFEITDRKMVEVESVEVKLEPLNNTSIL